MRLWHILKASYRREAEQSPQPRGDKSARLGTTEHALGVVNDSLQTHERRALTEASNVGVNVGAGEAVLDVLRTEPRSFRVRWPIATANGPFVSALL